MKKMRRGFGLVAAIFFIVLVATTAITALSIATMTARDTSNIHNREQALLLAQSATEYAVLAMQKHQYPANTAATENCLNSMEIKYQPDGADEALFNINVKIDYLDPNLPASCSSIGSTALVGVTGNEVKTRQALVDVTVESTDALGEPKIRYHRRTIQRP